MLAKTQDANIICVTEHWLRKENQNLFKPIGYKWSSIYTRENYIHGGAGILCREELSSTEVDDLKSMSDDTHFEIAATHIPNLQM